MHLTLRTWPKRTNKVALGGVLDASLTHASLVAVRLGFANEWHRGIVAVRQSLELVVDPEQLYDALTMRLVGVGEQPQPDLAPVNILEELAQLGIRLDDGLQRQSVVHLGVVVHGVNLVVTHETLDRETVVCVVLAVQPHRLLMG